jgi:DnaJ-class molecular chaperone
VNAWAEPHELEIDVCRHCQGSGYVPAEAGDEERLVQPCEKCKGKGKK